VGWVILGLLAICAIVSTFASALIGDIAGVVFLLVLLGVLMNTFVGRTMSTMSEGERTQFFQRMYQPRKRWHD
jgi:hypothetical protein